MSTPFPAIPTGFFPGLDADKNDKININYADGFLEIRLQKPNGQVLTQKGFTKGGFKQMTVYNPTELSRNELIELTNKMYASGLTQQEISLKLGLSQSTISNYVRKNK